MHPKRWPNEGAPHAAHGQSSGVASAADARDGYASKCQHARASIEALATPGTQSPSPFVSQYPSGERPAGHGCLCAACSR